MDSSTKASESDLYKENQSLFMEILAANSSDCLSLIFNCLTSLKEKFRLERVCKTFRKHARSFAAWSNVTNLIIKSDRHKSEKHLINDEYIPTVHLESAIEAIVVRIRNVEVIDLHLCAQSIAYSSVALTIIQQGARSYRNLKELFLNGNYSEAFSQSIFQLVAIFQSQLQILKLLSVSFADSNEKICFWNRIGNCPHLKKLIFIQPSNEKNEKQVLDTIKVALRGKSIESLEISIAGIKTDDLIEIISSLSDRYPLRSLYSRFQSLIDLAHRLPAVYRNSLHHIAYQNADDFNKFWPSILNLLRLFPQLIALELYLRSRDFTQNEAVNLIVSYLSIMNEENSRRSQFLKLTLNKYVLDEPSYEKVLAVLVNDHKCHIQPTDDDTFMIQYDGKGPACIELCI